MRSFVMLGGMALALSGCAELFSNEPEIERLEPAPEVFVEDRRQSVRSVSSVRRDRLPGGIVVTAVGRPDVQGFWDAELVPLTEDGPVNGELTFEFRVAEPVLPTPPGTERSREIVAARFISDIQLQGVNRIVVNSNSNSRSVRP
ncbi:hypothetical protein [Dinoroseobacter sp. S76]|uniref:hypothetical protein n=1 Tax=Dinoroseobacter sp. S76 TaxID=3415124 RepID=UPI003C7D53FF